MRAITLLEQLQSMCRKSFYMFVKEMWSTIIPEPPVWSPHIKFLCDRAQHGMERIFKGLPKEKDLVVNQPPSTTKSIVFSIMLPAWGLTRMRSLRTLVSTHTERLGLDLSRKSRNVVKSEKFREIFPGLDLEEDQDTKGFWVVKGGGERQTATVGGKNPMGSHAHLIITDDPIDPTKVLSKAFSETAIQFMEETLPSRKIDQQISWSILVMQRLGQGDPTANKLKEKNVEHICLPAEESDNISPPDARRLYTNGLLDPIRLPKNVLDEKRVRPYYYAGQYLQRPVAKGGGTFQIARVSTPQTSHPPLISVVRFWDTALTTDGAYTVGWKMGDDGQNFWILHVARERKEPGERNRWIKAIADMDGKGVEQCIEQPNGFGKESAEATARALAGHKVRLEPVKSNKETRWDTFADVWNVGGVFMMQGEWNQDMLDEYEHCPRSAYKDQLDAGSDCFARLIAIRAEKEAKERERRMLEGELLTNNIPKQHLEKIKREKQNRQQEADTKEVETKILTSRGEVEIDWDQER